MKYGYNFDGLNTIHNCDFMENDKIKAALKRGGDTLSMCNMDVEFTHYWRIYIALWCAKKVSLLSGDFAEFGVASGLVSSAICNYLDWDTLNKTYYLLDTFQGIDKTQLLESEVAIGRSNPNSYDNINYENIITNFSEWKNIVLIKGIIPNTLNQVTTKRLSFIHIDLNCSEPEKCVFMEMYPKLVSNGIMLLDDYGYNGYHTQKLMWDELSKQFNFDILSLPTGQGLIIKH